MADQAEHAKAFAELHVKGSPLVLFNIWDAGSAQAVARAGARALATGSWPVAAAQGYEDGETLPLDLVAANLERIVAAVDLPVSLDFESGYGRAPDEVSAGAGARGFFAPSLVDERLIGPLASRHGPYRRSGQGSSLDRGGLIRVMAGEHSIEVLDGLPAEIERTVEAGHLVHEQTHGVVCAYKLFSMVIRGEGGAAIAVLTAYTAYAEVYVDDIWVDEHYRGQGLGTKLLTALEERYRGQGYNNINLVTSAFQAADFYLKCGFEIEFFRQNQHNPELTKTFMVKFFDGVPQHRGTLGKDQGR